MRDKQLNLSSANNTLPNIDSNKNKENKSKFIEFYKEAIEWNNMEIDYEELKKYSYNKEGIWIPRDNE